MTQDNFDIAIQTVVGFNSSDGPLEEYLNITLAIGQYQYLTDINEIKENNGPFKWTEIILELHACEKGRFLG